MSGKIVGVVEIEHLILRAVRLALAQNKRPMKITDQHRKKLCHLLHHALIEMRVLSWAGKSAQTADLADAFHNLPKDMWREDFSLEYFRDAFLKDYHQKYSEGTMVNYAAAIDEMLASGEDYRMN
jgi:hypothetical protein